MMGKLHQCWVIPKLSINSVICPPLFGSVWLLLHGFLICTCCNPMHLNPSKIPSFFWAVSPFLCLLMSGSVFTSGLVRPLEAVSYEVRQRTLHINQTWLDLHSHTVRIELTFGIMYCIKCCLCGLPFSNVFSQSLSLSLSDICCLNFLQICCVMWHLLL